MSNMNLPQDFPSFVLPTPSPSLSTSGAPPLRPATENLADSNGDAYGMSALGVRADKREYHHEMKPVALTEYAR